MIGFGAPTKAGTAGTHGAPLGDEEIAGAREKLGWPHAPFECPTPCWTAWRAPAPRGAAASAAWDQRSPHRCPARADEFERRIGGDLPDGWSKTALQSTSSAVCAEKPSGRDPRRPRRRCSRRCWRRGCPS